MYCKNLKRVSRRIVDIIGRFNMTGLKERLLSSQVKIYKNVKEKHGCNPTPFNMGAESLLHIEYIQWYALIQQPYCLSLL